MWSIILEHSPAEVSIFVWGILVLGFFWATIALILGLIALIKGKPEDYSAILAAISNWWRRK